MFALTFELKNEFYLYYEFILFLSLRAIFLFHRFVELKYLLYLSKIFNSIISLNRSSPPLSFLSSLMKYIYSINANYVIAIRLCI